MTDSPIWGMVICTVAARVAIRTSTVARPRRVGGYGGRHAAEPAQVLGLGPRGPAAPARAGARARDAVAGPSGLRRGGRGAAGGARRPGAPAAPARAASVAERHLPRRSLRARRARLRQVLPRRRARLPGSLRPPARRGRTPGRRVRPGGAPRLVRERRRGRHPVRRRHERGGRGRAGGGRRLRGRRDDRPQAARSRSRGGPGVPGGPHPGGRYRSAARGAAARARPDAASLPAVVRVLDARRLDRHARGRAFRDARHSHRRLRRVGAGSSRHAESGRAGACRAPARDRARIGC